MYLVKINKNNEIEPDFVRFSLFLFFILGLEFCNKSNHNESERAKDKSIPYILVFHSSHLFEVFEQTISLFEQSIPYILVFHFFLLLIFFIGLLTSKKIK